MATIDLHSFCDGSQHTYAACVYLRIELDNAVEIRLMTAKSHIAPQKCDTIPRLKLRAASLLAVLITNAYQVKAPFTLIRFCMKTYIFKRFCF